MSERRGEYDAISERLGVDAEDPAVQADLKRLANEPKPPRRGTASPGWYPCQGRLRWWDGTAWTDQWGSAKPHWSKSAELGMWLALFLPFVGFFVGLALIAGRDPHAHWVVLTSVVVPIAVVLLLAT